jgi:hypothetical protein
MMIHDICSEFVRLNEDTMAVSHKCHQGQIPPTISPLRTSALQVYRLHPLSKETRFRQLAYQLLQLRLKSKSLESLHRSACSLLPKHYSRRKRNLSMSNPSLLRHLRLSPLMNDSAKLRHIKPDYTPALHFPQHNLQHILDLRLFSTSR